MLVICLAVFYFFGVVSTIGMAWLHFPLFLLGFIIRGFGAFVLTLALAALILAIGLLRRQQWSWFLTFAFQLYGIFSSLFLVLPSNRRALARYQQETSLSMLTRFGLSVAPANLLQGSTVYVFSGVFVILFAAAVIWLLLRARPYFGFPRSA